MDNDIYWLKDKEDYIDFEDADVFVSKYGQYRCDFVVSDDVSIEIYMDNFKKDNYKYIETYYQDQYNCYCQPYDALGYWHVINFDFSNGLMEQGACVDSIDE